MALEVLVAEALEEEALAAGFRKSFNNQIYFEVKRMGLFGKKKKFDEHDPDINCPRCHVPMFKKTRMGVTIDKCKKCDGIWLDGGEIEKILMKIQEEQKKFREKQKVKKKKA